MSRDGGNDITVLYLQNKINFKRCSKIPHKTHTHTTKKQTDLENRERKINMVITNIIYGRYTDLSPYLSHAENEELEYTTHKMRMELKEAEQS